MELYKGFIKTKDKKAAERFKNRTNYKTYEEVESLDEFAGVLAQDVILIDIDDEVQAEKLAQIIEDEQIDCRIVTTNRGKHFLFKNTGVSKCYTHVKLACGLTADIKVGSKNSYEILRYGGKDREIEWGDYSNYPHDIVSELPKWLYPIPNTTYDFIELEEGDGRNQTLFNYILFLQSHDFSVEDCRHTIRRINRYILKSPLSEDELDVILRDDAFSKPIFFKGATFLFDKFATFLKNNHHIKRINNQLHIYKDGIYVPGLSEIEGAMIQHIPDLNQSKRKEVLSYLDVILRDNTELSSSDYVAFRNGILNIKTKEIVEYSPDIVVTNKIDWDYNPHAYDELLDSTLNKISCYDSEIRQMLEEMVGYCFFRRNELGKAFILSGEGSNGKSTLLNMIRHLLGKNNCSSLDLKKIGDRFSTVMLFGKLANIGDDISSEFLADVAEFRKVVTGDSIAAEQKGQPKFDFEPYCKLIFSSNSIPRMGKGKDFNAIKRRLIIIPFNARFSKDDPDYVPYISDRLKTQQAMEYLILLGLKGLDHILENRGFTESEASRRELTEYEITSNPIVGFMSEYDEGDIINQPSTEIYQLYILYCNDNKLSAIGRRQFVTQLCKQLNLTSKQLRIDNERVQVLVKK